MARYNFLVFSNCTDPAREEEFNRWYTHIHVPDLSSAKGLVSARRYVNLEPDAKAKYLAVYEFETENIDESMNKNICYNAKIKYFLDNIDGYRIETNNHKRESPLFIIPGIDNPVKQTEQ